MPEYDVTCQVHGEQEVTASMKDAMDGLLRCQAPIGGNEACGMPVTRRYSVPQEISDNSFPGAGRVSTQLAPDGGVVKINTRRDERVLMQMAGVRPYDKGEYAKHKADTAKARSEAATARRTEGIQRMYYAKNHPESKQR
jgi:hypothetical protein